MPIPTPPHIAPVIPEGYKFIALMLVDGSVAIMGWPTIRRDASSSEPYEWLITPERVEARIRQEGHQVTSWREIAYADIPHDRTYRNAWSDIGTKALVHDLTKAKAIHRDHLRVHREPKLAALDVAYQRALEQGDKAEQKRIAAQKQALRDLPAHPDIDKAQSIDDLKAVWFDDEG